MYSVYDTPFIKRKRSSHPSQYLSPTSPARYARFTDCVSVATRVHSLECENNILRGELKAYIRDFKKFRSRQQGKEQELQNECSSKDAILKIMQNILKEIKDHLECPICLEVLKEPRTGNNIASSALSYVLARVVIALRAFSSEVTNSLERRVMDVDY
ncbi:hypothetical protein CPB86DRAFT_802681 [Serendipita vermifera]|nr:hypothetical protein CPB86DRAFT_802681 [Serendipita vermifera]